MMKRILCLMMALCLLLTGMAFAEDEEYSMEGIFIEVETEEPEETDSEGAVFFDEDTDELLDTLHLDVELDESVDPASLDLNENLPDNVVNILLIGIDTRDTDMEGAGQRGDVQLILSLNKDDGSVKLTSILRDLYVTIPGYRNKNRINTSYERGGGELAMRTVNKNFEMNIEYYATINFYGLASIIDAIGGIDIELTRQEAKAINDYINKNLKKGGYDNQGADYERQPLEKIDGTQHLDGVQAVMYARVRSIDNDFARSARQRKLLELLLGKIMQDMTIDKLMGLIETSMPYVETNVGLNTMLELALGLLNGGIIQRAQQGESLIDQHRIPMDETWKYFKTEGGASVVVFRTVKRREENVQALHEFIYGAYYPAGDE